MRTFTLNIGTVKGSNHGSTTPQLPVITLFNQVRNELDRIGVKSSVTTRWSDGGDWDPELIIVADVVCRINHENDDLQDLWFAIKDLLRSCDQDAIAIDGIKHNEGGYVLFHPHYTGERYLFTRKHFVQA